MVVREHDFSRQSAKLCIALSSYTPGCIYGIMWSVLSHLAEVSEGMVVKSEPSNADMWQRARA